ncbi:MAG: leader peptidase (prepilin peptidase) / N-methyltransferase [Pseudonocardiales bacterium]|jgi:leader peptidase (prepilin peptidase)/N-methyltransferase|nr:leader peptidase (prepilin peptidase) / N-methyltransferase [Pseudonocardiales bacterium]
MTTPLPIVGLIGLAGLAVGSFLNVVIYRVPRHESIVFPASHCPECSEPIKARHNVPVLSWVALRGRCHACKGRISRRYPLVEAGTAVLFAAVTLRFGVSLQLVAYLYLVAIGVVLAMIDFEVRRLPDSITLPSYVVSVLLLMPAGAVDGDWMGAGRALAGMVALLALFFALAIAYPNGLGTGDVKLAGLVGLYLGWLSWNAVFLAAIGSILIAGAAGSAAVATKHATRNLAVPLGPCLIGAAGLALFVAAPVASWYGSLITV